MADAMKDTTLADVAPQSGNARLERAYRLDLNIGARMMLRLGWGGENAAETPAELIGYGHYEFILVRVQPSPGLLKRVTQGTLVNVRFLNAGGSAVFQTEITGYLARPVMILALAYPQTMNTVQVRKHKRLACAWPALIGKDDWKVSGIISDISLGGCRMVIDARGNTSARALTAGDALEVRIPMNLETGMETVTAIVKKVDLEQFRLLMGLSFESMPHEAQQRLESFLVHTEVLLA